MKLSFYPYPLRLQHAFTVTNCSRTATPGVQVEITHEGMTGYGEASMPPYLGENIESVTHFLQQVDLSRFTDPFCIEDIICYVDQIAPGNTAAKASVDIALHDLIGKLLNAPWYKLWGLNVGRLPYTSYTIGIDTPEMIQKKIAETNDRFRVLKIKLNGQNDEEIIRSVRSATHLPLTIDANQAWTDRREALDKIQWLHEQGAVFIEQPMPKHRLDDIAWVTQHSPLPIFADESVQRLTDIPHIRGAFTGINIKLMKCTGMREGWKMLTVARALGMKVMIGCMTETSCAISAAAQLAAAADFADLDGNLLITNDLFKGVTIQNGKLSLPDRPGIGIEKVRNASIIKP